MSGSKVAKCVLNTPFIQQERKKIDVKPFKLSLRCCTHLKFDKKEQEKQHVMEKGVKIQKTDNDKYNLNEVIIYSIKI